MKAKEEFDGETIQYTFHFTYMLKNRKEKNRQHFLLDMETGKRVVEKSNESGT